MTTPRVAILGRGGSWFIGIETDDLDARVGLRYPALIQLVSLPAPGPLAGQMGIQTLTMPIALPFPVLALQAGEILIALGVEDQTYPVARDFLPQYFELVERVKKAERTAAPRRLVTG